MNDNVLIALITGACTALPAIVAILVNEDERDGRTGTDERDSLT